MKTLKKSLAIVIALALCLSAFMGCFSVSAVDANGVSIATKIDGDTAIVDFTLEAVADDAFTVALFDIEFDKALNIVGIPVKGIDPATELPYPDEPAIEISTTSDVELAEISHNSITNGVADVRVANAAKAIRVIVETKQVAKIADATVTITFDIAGLEAKDYAVSATVQAATAGTYDGVNWGNDEKLIKFGDATTTTATGAITVKPAHVHEYSKVNYDETGHWTECTCGEKTDVEEHALSEAAEGEDGKWYKSCTCGYKKEVDAPVVGVKHTVTFVDEDGTVLDTQEVDDGTAATAPELVRKIGYSAAWDVDFTNITADTTVTAVYTAAILTTKGMSAQLALKSSFQIGFKFSDANLGDGTLLYATVDKLVVKDGVESYSQSVFEGGDFYRNGTTTAFDYSGIAAKEMTNEIKIKFYYELDGVLYSSKEGSASVAKLVLSELVNAKRNQADGWEAFLALGMDMINYGTAAQNYYGYRTDDLANMYVNGSNSMQDYASYATTSVPDFTDTITATTSGTHLYGLGFTISLELGNAIGLNVEIKKGTADFTNYDFKFTYTDATNVERNITVPFSEISDKTNDSTRYLYVIRELAAKDLRKNISFAVYDAEGNAVSKVATVSIAGYARDQMTNTANTDLVNAMFRYSDSAAYYFSNY